LSISPPRPCGGFWHAITSSPGAIISGSILRNRGTPLFIRPSPRSSTSTRVHCRMTSWSCQSTRRPRCRRHPTQAGNLPHRHAHAYKGRGALTLFAAFDIRTEHVFGGRDSRKRPPEFIAFLEQLDAASDHHITTIHLVCDNLSTHHGTEVRQWLVQHPRVVFHLTPVHGSWMHQVEQWFSIFQRKRLRSLIFNRKSTSKPRLDGSVVIGISAHIHATGR
jgi:transposase